MSPSRFAVVGAGLGGSLMAVYLARAGHQVDVFEGRPDPRRAGADAGRSINLAISQRGLHALGEVGLADAVLAEALAMRGRMIHSPAGGLTFQPYGTETHHRIHSVSRAGLNRILIEAAEAAAGVRVHFDHRCKGVDLDRGIISFHPPREAGSPGSGQPGSGQPHSGRAAARQEAPDSFRADAIVGADGAFSAVRSRMQRTDRFDYQQSYLEHGYKELTIPPAPGGGFSLASDALHIWPRGGYMMIALPNKDASFTCTLFWPYEGPNSFAALRTGADVRAFFASTFPDALPLMPDLADEYFANPVGALVTVRCRPWHHADRAVLLGDACHAVVPFYGQGANAAFEDCFLLDAALARHPDDREAGFRDYEDGRRVHAEALADLAIENFVEMRDHTASRLFLAKKALERGLHRLFPRSFLPLNSMISFSRIPYADAVRRARRQWWWVVALAAASLLGLLAALIAAIQTLLS